ncbi:MAG: hypothetical protein IPP13_28000 [Kouleothrix sp.]|jgi:hypothetical protein|nr:hypothetical protein [Kouleothrix sp.]MBK9945450.1 hypothetical protein [Kouleothrix sp.]
MIADARTVDQTVDQIDLIDQVWEHIPGELDTEHATRVAATAIALLSEPSDAEFERAVALLLYPSLATGLAFTIAFALLGYALLAWGGAAAFFVSAAIYVSYLVMTEPE